jgi:hypothetical protein
LSRRLELENGPQEDVLVGVGVDWLTATAVETGGYQPMHSAATAIFRTQADEGNEPKPWGMAGFKGWRCGSVEIGRRNDETLVRLSSDSAYLSWRQIAQHANNISRIDLQATVLPIDGPTQTINKHRRDALADSEKTGNKKVVRWIQDNREGYTLYLGNRTSICFGRIYDKYQHSKMDHYRGCVRYEVQYHNKLAVHIASALGSDYRTIPRITSYISQFFRGREIRLEFPDKNWATYSCTRRRSDAEKNLAWLAASVRPTVSRLIALGRGEEVLRALGLIDEQPPTEIASERQVGPSMKGE